MRTSQVRDVRDAVVDESRRATDALDLQRAVARHLSRVVPFDRWCGLTMDPGTTHPTGGYHAEGVPEQLLPRLVEIENSTEPEVVRLRDLAVAPFTARTLSSASDGDLARSARYRDVLEPSGVRHEIRTVFRGEGGTWGAAIFMRGPDAPDFGPGEVAVLASVSAVVAEGIRRTTVLGAAATHAVEGPGLLLCTAGARITVDHATDAARQWLEEIDDARADGLPYAIAALVHATAWGASGERRVRIRTRSGRWLTLHAERLGPSGVSVIVEPTRARDIASLVADACRLTAREREVAALAVRGLSNTQIGKALYLSPYTVNDHLKRVFDKSGVTSRTELAAKLFFDHTGDGPGELL